MDAFTFRLIMLQNGQSAIENNEVIGVGCHRPGRLRRTAENRAKSVLPHVDAARAFVTGLVHNALKDTRSIAESLRLAESSSVLRVFYASNAVSSGEVSVLMLPPSFGQPSYRIVCQRAKCAENVHACKNPRRLACGHYVDLACAEAKRTAEFSIARRTCGNAACAATGATTSAVPPRWVPVCVRCDKTCSEPVVAFSHRQRATRYGNDATEELFCGHVRHINAGAPVCVALPAGDADRCEWCRAGVKAAVETLAKRATKTFAGSASVDIDNPDGVAEGDDDDAVDDDDDDDDVCSSDDDVDEDEEDGEVMPSSLDYSKPVDFYKKALTTKPRLKSSTKILTDEDFKRGSAKLHKASTAVLPKPLSIVIEKAVTDGDRQRMEEQKEKAAAEKLAREVSHGC